jgi:NodT family efflux transporter outer membrane factor (OMF) lipoprotein
MKSALVIRKFCAATAGLLLIGGCTVGPDYQRPGSALSPVWQEAQQVGLDTQPTALTRWWTEFNDALLDSLVERAVKSNLDLFVAEARIREARAVVGATGADLWPSLDVSGSISRIRTSENALGLGRLAQQGGGNLEQNLFRTGFDSNWEIDVFGGTRRRVEAAEALLDASEEERRSVLVTLLGDVAKNYIDVRGLQRRLAVAQENLKAQQETLRLTKIRFDAGIASDLEVAQAEGLAQTTAAQIPLLESALKQTVYRLDVLLGAQPGMLWSELARESPIPALPPQARVGMPVELLRRRPDIRSAERQLAAATAQVGAATADLYPKFSLTGAFGLQSVSASDWFTGRSRFWSIGPTISWPVFDAGRIRANIEIRNAQQEQSLRLYEKSVLTALGEVESALVNYSKEQSRYRSLLEAVSANRRAMQMADDLYTQGLVTFLSVLDAQRTLYSSESDLAQSEANMASNLVALYKALGGGWETK